MPDQFRRCAKCGFGDIFPETPHTALPCSRCEGEALIAAITTKDLANERDKLVAQQQQFALALERLAAACKEGAGDDGKVSADGAAGHMNALAKWMREGGK